MTPSRIRIKALVQQLYEGIVGGTVTVLENRLRNEVATKGELSGPATSPTMSTWQVVTKLIQNAFFKAILLGFEREAKERYPLP